ncbi:hypothetical protein CTI14_66740, partial [Methylobacterium radiotolerans]
MAEALGIPVGTVRSRLNRVRRRLAPPGSRGQTRLTWMAKEESDAAYGTPTSRSPRPSASRSGRCGRGSTGSDD